MIGTSCCLPQPPCGEVVCEVVESAEVCARLAQLRSDWCPNPLECIPGRRLAVPAGAVKPSWEDAVEVFVYIPLATQLAMVVVWIGLQRLYHNLFQGARFRKFVLTYIGSHDYPIPRQPWFLTLLALGQILASLWAVVIFVINCYELCTLPAVRYMNSILGIFQTFYYFTIGLHREFRLHYLFSSGQLVDILTLPAMLWFGFRPASQDPWLTLNFLRAISALHAYERLDRQGALRLGLGEVTHELILMVFRFMSLIVCFASCVFTLEVLGPMPIERESMIPTAMGDISFFTMLYWVIETISTVGYGDYAPKTFLSRLTTMAFMIAGVAFFTVEFQRILEMASNDARGTGFYKKTKRQHIVLLGGGVRYFDTAIILSFLDEVYHQSYRNSWPDLVVMSQSTSIEKVREVVEIHLEKAAQQNITYLVGSPLKICDLKRTRCETAMLVVIIADTTGHLDPYQEDKLNILRAMSLHRGFPRTPLRLMLLMSESREKALSVGIREQRVFTLNDLRSGILGASCRCVGLNTLLSNLIVTTESFEIAEEQKSLAPWLENYVSGMDHEVYGLLAAEEFHGMEFPRFVIEAYTRNEVCIFAAQIKGKIELAPGEQYGLIDDRTVFFALAKSEEQIKGIALDTKKWEEQFAANRWRLFEEDDLRRARQSKIHGDLSNLRLSGMNLTPIGGGSRDSQRLFPRRSTPQNPDGRGSVARMSAQLNARRSGNVAFQDVDDLDNFEDNRIARMSVEMASYRGNGDLAFGHRISDVGRSIWSSQSPARALMADLEESDDNAQTGMGMQRGDQDEIFKLGRRVQDIIRNAEKSPFILLLDLSGSWIQVPAFVKQTRAKGLPYSMPIVVLCPVLPPRAYLNDLNVAEDPNFAWVVGNPVSAQDLISCGVAECCVVVCLGLGIDRTLAEGGTDGTEMLDADVVMLQRMLDLIGEEGRHVILEFKRAQNMRLLPTIGQEGQEGWRLAQDAQQVNMEKKRYCSWIRDMLCGDEKKEQNSDVEYCLDPRFASGQIFAPNVLGTLVACEYRMPGMIEMIQMLVMPPVSSGNYLWQIHLMKDFVGKTYGQLFSALVRAPEAALPLGLLRRFPKKEAPGMGYVWTNPGKDTLLHASDLLFVISSSKFGQMAHSMGLLPFHSPDSMKNRASTAQSMRSSTPFSTAPSLTMRPSMGASLSEPPSKASRTSKGPDLKKRSPRLVSVFSEPTECPTDGESADVTRPLSPREPLL